MLHNTVTYRTGRGWDASLPAAMDGPQTLVLAFAASEFAGNSGPFAELAVPPPERSPARRCTTPVSAWR